jgi:hypothetical protein
MAIKNFLLLAQRSIIENKNNNFYDNASNLSKVMTNIIKIEF